MEGSTRSQKVKRAGPKKAKAERSGANLGRSLVRHQFPTVVVAPSALETERGKHKLRSVTQCDDLEELMSQAHLAGTDFTSKRGETLIVGSEARTRQLPTQAPKSIRVTVPRRPVWCEGQSAEELESNERAAFLDWRRGLADLEENQGYLLTPFEKNLEVWRQLWRVLERAQLIVQIVDARNPLLFYSEDLARYVHEVDPKKRTILLINKADLLTDAQRRSWAAYLAERGIEFVFWSAAAAQAALEEQARRERMGVGPVPVRQRASSSAADDAAAPSHQQPGLRKLLDEDDDEEDEDEAVTVQHSAAKAAAIIDAKRGSSGRHGSERVVEEEKGDDDDGDGDDGDDDDDDDEDAMLARMTNARAASRSLPQPSQLPEDAIDVNDEASEEASEESDGAADGDDMDAATQSQGGAEPLMALGKGHGTATATTHVHTREELLTLLVRRCPRSAGRRGGRNGSSHATIGLVGYPNVGKSSTVNVLVAAKKTSVSATPGKTKHFQTLEVPDVAQMTLCDCPGLVFPTVAGSKAQMICDGILPIDQMKEYMPPIALLVQRLPKSAFEQCYSLRLRSDVEREEDPDMPDLARELLMAHALARGFMTTTKGTPDESRSARVILKDLVNAKLLYAEPPPGEAGKAAAVATDGVALAATASVPGRRLPQAPTTTRWLEKMKADYEAQEGSGAHYAASGGRKGRRKGEQPGAAAMRSMQWRPMGGSALPDRIVAQGRHVEME